MMGLVLISSYVINFYHMTMQAVLLVLKHDPLGFGGA
jgi:hypothetical protein